MIYYDARREDEAQDEFIERRLSEHLFEYGFDNCEQLARFYGTVSETQSALQDELCVEADYFFEQKVDVWTEDNTSGWKPNASLIQSVVREMAAMLVDERFNVLLPREAQRVDKVLAAINKLPNVRRKAENVLQIHFSEAFSEDPSPVLGHLIDDLGLEYLGLEDGPTGPFAYFGSVDKELIPDINGVIGVAKVKIIYRKEFISIEDEPWRFEVREDVVHTNRPKPVCISLPFSVFKGLCANHGIHVDLDNAYDADEFYVDESQFQWLESKLGLRTKHRDRKEIVDEYVGARSEAARVYRPEPAYIEHNDDGYYVVDPCTSLVTQHPSRECAKIMLALLNETR